MTAEQLRNSILQEAFSGSLTHDDLSEWEYVTLGDICNFGKCESVDVKDIPNDAWVLELEDIEKDTARILKRLSLRERKIKGTRHKFQKGQLLYSKLRTYLNKVLVAPADGYCTGEIVPITFKEDISVEYMCHFMRSPFVLQYTASCGYGIKMPRVNPKQMNGIEVPLPPLAEQKRIVAKLEELLPIVEQYGKAQTELDELNAALPARLRQSILQEAISGRLVPQDPNDEPASVLLQRIREEKARLVKEGKLKKKDLVETPITDDEKPFEIPDNWEWVKLSTYVDVRDGTHDSPKYHPSGIPFVTSKNLKDGRIDFSTCTFISQSDHDKFSERSYVEDGDILFAMIGSIGNPVIVAKDREFSVKNVALFKRYSREYTNNKYLYYYLSYIQNELKQIAAGGVQSFVGLGTLRQYLIPLPPLAEQQRIVAKIEELFEQINRLSETK